MAASRMLGRESRLERAPGHGDEPRQKRARRRLSGERGDVVEAVILTPVLLSLVLVVVQGALVFHARAVVTAAAQDAARAAQSENASAAAGQSAANQILAGSENLLEGESVSVNRGGNVVTATVRARVTSVVPFWNPQVSSTVSGPVERFRPQGDR